MICESCVHSVLRNKGHYFCLYYDHLMFHDKNTCTGYIRYKKHKNTESSLREKLKDVITQALGSGNYSIPLSDLTRVLEDTNETV